MNLGNKIQLSDIAGRLNIREVNYNTVAIDTDLVLDIHLLFINDLCLEFSEEIQNRLVIICLSHKRMFEQFLNVRPLMGIFNKALLQEVIEFFRPSRGMIKSWWV